MRRWTGTVLAVWASASLAVPTAASGPSGLAPGGSVCPAAAGQPGAVAVLNLTPVLASAPGFGAVRASDAPSNNSLGAAAVSNVNFRPESVDPNVAFATIGTDRRVCFDNSPHANVHLIADQMGVMPATAFEPASASGATRLVDTRSGPALAPGATVCAPAVGSPGRVAVVNITPVGASRPGFAAVRASDAPSNNSLGASAVSDVNFGVGSVDPNLAFARIGLDGHVCIDNSNHSSVHLIVDQMGSLGADVMVPSGPTGATRLIDTRRGLVVGGVPVSSVAPGAAVCAAAVGAPGDVAVVNGTPVQASRAGYMAVRPSNAPSNNTRGANAVSNWNFSPGSVDPNVAFAEIGPDGMICVDNSNHGSVQMVLDQAGYLRSGRFVPAATTGALRVVDTRRGFVAEPPEAPPPPEDTVPSAPTSVVATAGRLQVVVTWEPPQSDGGLPIAEYAVQRSVDGSTWTTIATVPAIDNTYTDSGNDALVAGRDLHYRVAARNAVGFGPPSEMTTAAPVDVPGAPTELWDHRTYEETTTCIYLTWKPPASDGGRPLIGYRVQRSTSSGWHDWAVVTDPGVNLGCWVDSALTYRIVAYNEVGDGVPSATRTIDPPYRPRQPQCAATAYDVGDAEVAVTWGSPAGDYADYPIYRYDIRILRHTGEPGAVWTQVGDVVNVGFAFEYSWVVQRGAWYVIQARAWNALGSGRWCDGTPVWAS